jgi:pyrroloquinoline quinone biosynthesis protein B
MKVMVLGSGQDAGIPHTGCNCKVCAKAKKDTKYRRWGPSIAIFDQNSVYLIDASPDLKYQMDMLQYVINEKESIPISGIILTHAHYGHISGLWQLGEEAANEKNVPVYCTAKTRSLLSENYPFNLLVQSKNIEIREIMDKQEFELKGFKCAPILVPHRNAVANTVGYIIQSDNTLVYIPDIDRWTEKILREIKEADIALIDGTFYSKDEIPRFDSVPHPPISETVELFKDIKTEIYFTHINHTNIINKNGKEKKEIESKGFKIAFDGMILDI